ncbi:helix-turn-helix transcriptional regulator [Mariniflexile sp. HMF6888]|uniref:helix-turn-helix transcriptional regulator n=1 Tax=Mariniflexile sp. HMF6888 TaxID=3373086 RepID=UPI0037B290A4
MERLKKIQTVLMEFASGNFAYKLERSNLNDDIEALAELVNMTLEEIKDSFFHQGYVNIHETYKYVVQMFFLLDKEETIITYNSRIKQLLFIDDSELQGKIFSSFLTQKSKLAWDHLKSRLVSAGLNPHEEYIVLSFKTKKRLTLTINCLVGKFIDETSQSERIIITAIEIVKSSKEREIALKETVTSGKKESKKKSSSYDDKQSNDSRLNSTDIRKIRQIHDHILKNLDKPLLPLIELAHTFGTNEYKVKHGFKQLYGHTVFRFLIDERLKRASLLIQHTDIPLKEVAHITGFVSIPHFSKAFKKKYGYTPRDLRKQSYKGSV